MLTRCGRRCGSLRCCRDQALALSIGGLTRNRPFNPSFALHVLDLTEYQRSGFALFHQHFVEQLKERGQFSRFVAGIKGCWRRWQVEVPDLAAKGVFEQFL